MGFIVRQGTRGRLVTLAESGSPDHLAEKFQNHPQVFDFVAGSNVIFPGNSLTLSSDSSHPYFSAVGMLAQTNDAFFGLNSAMLPDEGEMAPETYDWRNPVVKITVVRTN